MFANRYFRFAVPILVILGTIGYLAVTGAQATKSYYVTIKELHTMGDSAYSRRLRVAGNVQPGSIKRSGTHVEFILVEENQVLPVVYRGSEPPPDTFKDNSQALADGRFGKDGVFQAKQLQAKCASKYAPKNGQPAPGTPSAVTPARTAANLNSSAAPRAAQ